MYAQPHTKVRLASLAPRSIGDRKVEHESHGEVIDMERSTFEAMLLAVTIGDSIGGWGSCDH